MISKLRRQRCLLLIAIAVVLAACHPPNQLFADQPLQAGEPLKIGVIVPETGTYAKISLPIIDALLLMRDTVNACGGVNRAPISLVFYDHEAERQTEATGMRHLVNDVDVHGIVAALIEPLSIDTLAIALDRDVSVISPTTTATVQPKRRLSLRGWGQLSLTETQQGRALAKLAIAQGWQRAGLLVSDTDSGLRFARAFTPVFESLDGVVVNNGPMLAPAEPLMESESGSFFSTAAPSEESDAAAADTSDAVALARTVDVLVASLDGPQGYSLLKSVVEQAPGLPVLLTHSQALAIFGEGRFQHLDPNRPYVLSGAMGLLPPVDTDVLQTLASRWQDADKFQWGEYVPQAWDAATLLVLAAEAAGRNWRSGIQERLKEVANPPGVRVTQVCEGLTQLRKGAMINYQGASGTVDLGTEGQLSVTSQYRRWQLSASGKIRWGDSITLR